MQRYINNENIAAAEKIARSVSEAGGRVYYVGGFVRDTIRNTDNKDIDIEVHGINPDVLEKILCEVGQPKLMGASFGIYGLSGCELDISLPRAVCAEGRGGKSDFLECVDPYVGEEEAAKRRDFTINALMQDVLNGEILDFFGGKEDLKNGIIRHTNTETFCEDPLRVVRAAQFAARFAFQVCPETLSLCRSINISEVAHERVYEELKKVLLKSSQPSVFFEVLRSMGQLDVWFPEVSALIDVQQPPAFHPEGDVWNHTMIVLDIGASLREKAENPLGFMLSLLCHDFGKAVTTTNEDGRIRSIGHEIAGTDIASAFIKRLTSDNNLRRYILNMTELHMRPNIIADQHSGSKAFCRLFDASICPEDLLLVSEADFLGCAKNEGYDSKKKYLYDMLELFNERMKQPYVTGKDLLQKGCMPGKEMGQALEYAHKLRLAGVCKKQALCQTLSYIRSIKSTE